MGVVGLHSCIDNAYDLNKDIDKTITVGGDLTIPGSNTEEMKLKDLLDIEDDSTVKTDENGNYFIIKTGDPSDSEVKVNEVNIEPDDNSFEKLSIGGLRIADGRMNISGDDARMKISITKEDIDDDLVDLEEATIREEVSSVMLSLSEESGAVMNGSDFSLGNGFEIVFPDYVTVSEISEFCNAEGNILRLNRDVVFNQDGTLPIYFSIKKITFAGYNGANFDSENHSISLIEDIIINGDIISETDNGSYSFNAEVVCNSISLESVTAKVNPEIEINIDPIMLENLPDFLTDNEVVFDASDPRIFLTVSNDSPLDANVRMEVVSVKEGVESETVLIEGVVIPGNSMNHTICVHQNRDIDIEGATDIYCDNLNEIIKRVPDMIEVRNVEAQIDQTILYEIEIGKSFNINTMYEVNTPLMFGGETQINYTETMDGWSEDMEDIELSSLEVSMTAINKIPLGLTMTAKAIDAYGNTLENVNVTVEGGLEASNGTEAKEKEMKFTLESNDGSRIKGLDGMEIRIMGTADEAYSNVQLNENQSLKLEDVKIKVTGGITMDLN